MNWNMGYMGWLGMLFFWGVFFWLVIWLIKQKDSEKGPEQILDIRLAKGEITTKEFKQTKKILKGG